MANDKKLLRESSALGGTETVTLGDTQYEVIPQRIGWLRSRLGVALGQLSNLQLDSDNVVGMLGARVYSVLQVFIPDLMEEWEFQGFPTREAMEKDEYDPDYDRSPTASQIKEAFAAATKVNEIDLLKHLGKLIGPEVIRGWMAGIMADELTARRTMRDSESPSVTTGPDTPSTTSGSPSPTSGLSAASLSPA